MMKGHRKGISMNKTKQIVQWLYKNVNDRCEWRSIVNPNTGKPWLLMRDGPSAFEVYLHDVGNNVTGEGISYFHHSVIPENSPLIQTIGSIDNDNSDSDKEDYGLKDGNQYAIIPYKLFIGAAGDEASRIRHTPQHMSKWLALLGRVLIFIAEKGNTPHTCVPLLYVCNDPECYDKNIVNQCINEVLSSFKLEGHLKYYCESRGFWICIDYETKHCADWAFVYLFWTHSGGPQSKHGIVEITKIDSNGKFSTLENDNESLYECLIEGTTLEYDTFEELVKPDGSSFIITPPDLACEMGHQVEMKLLDEMEEANINGTIDRYTPEYQHERRKQISKELKHGFYYEPIKLCIETLFDLFHFMWNFGLFVITTFVILLWCVWGLSKEHVLLILSYLQCVILMIQYEKWMDSNEKRRIYNLPKVKARGPTVKKAINGLPYAIVAAMCVAEEYEYSNNDSIAIIHTILCVFYFVVVNMKEVFGIALMPVYYTFTFDGRSILVAKMIRISRLVGFVAYHLCTVLVRCTFMYCGCVYSVAYVHACMHACI